jgi:hypothetical protein
MATTDTLRTEPLRQEPPRAETPAAPPAAASVRPMSVSDTAAPAQPPVAQGGLSLDQFLSGKADDRLADLLAFAMAAEAGRPVTPDAVDRLRRAAVAELDQQAFRTLHNRVQEIRREAVAEELTKMRPPPGFLTIVLAVLVALVLAGAGLWFALPYLARFGA